MKNLIKLILAIVGIQALLMAEGFTLESPDVSGELSVEQLYDGFGCNGGNISPLLRWHGEPKGTKSFAVTLYDPDAPMGSGWWHWIVFNIPSDVHRLPKGAGDPKRGSLPKGTVQSVNDFGTVGYGGACPPVGDRPHRYVFTVYALDVESIRLPFDTPPAMVESTLEKHALAKASFVAYYGR
ncbi:YbhB/YbcL family Raf kinase inhibitor-like protein [Hydrogenimonas cancrithermarum]|uniref:Kinase inhibitor Raf n=1 Tax=Hydrogenimonas cancrithermarum TaxID=2993563 RepID=A0ABM8FIZ7_9BACT|nr:YbhB/YbcL family Raf kinase inhibitor-like protein [Hydrogenimonas cancrithermarum]BDY12265.1 kinase inhibitor Raf [Hydrogenimonas cancrithermarum]